MFRTTPRAAAILLSTALLVTACSESDSGTSEPADSSTVATTDVATTLDSTQATTTDSPTADSPTTSAALPTRPGPGGMSGSAPTPTHADLAYSDGSAAQVLDLWLPENAESATPLVIYIHGGAFKSGDKGMVGGKVQPLLDAGFAVASLDYRLSGEALFPAGAQDVKAAVRWLRANSAEYDLDPDRFATWGESAGGLLASLIGTSGDQTTILDDTSLGNAEVSSAVQAVVHWYGPTDFLQMDAQSASGEGSCTSPELHDPASSPESAWIGTAIQDAPDTVAPANPITYIAAATDLPAFSIAHGDADCNVPFQQSQILAQALTDVGADPTYTILPGATHADAQFDGTLLEPTIEWLLAALG